ncbi:hypothetical protein HQ325_15370 [Rhodococcus sp. BP-349]|uniref:hypothetical protein n=1 Tax=unclassified Rhodococcus (in: high G+C Gram-positive bacteria) TaxID=192944 RepID=UPI001C9AD7F5|nr:MULTISPECIES: hypothetical protein [unclassified Rhodococcus (in: high G+C Gram-positive bacteria)]MBY6540055.1 hypothetical protein [Rhodococcus sp. BP-363]MBY6543617.1 hypothetical protein [Rhodococcus sp. BP-369]MBY6562847.1 hypothetical protein [Rhodococcus sp. BP-370]MBY6577139.1 hypothetical protein [Rhodococcus sp. BP-364]MBY6586440.1 hypothetical protein [Rhodococcus sp. BP-358]
MSESFIYGEVDGNLVFARRDLAERLSALRSEFVNWGKARATLDTATLDEIDSVFSQSEIDQPEDAEPFDLDVIPGHADGDWPQWPAKIMLAEVPTEVIKKYGRVESSVLNGEFLILRPESETEIVQELRAHGWECDRDDSMILRASGF